MRVPASLEDEIGLCSFFLVRITDPDVIAKRDPSARKQKTNCSTSLQRLLKFSIQRGKGPDWGSKAVSGGQSAVVNLFVCKLVYH